MSITEYLRSRLWAFMLLALLEALVVLVLCALGANDQLVVFICLLIGVAWCCLLGIEYARERRFYDDLVDLRRLLDNPRMIPNLIEEPIFPEGRITLEALNAMAKATSDEAAEVRRQIEEYRSYVETWVHEAKSPLAAAHLMVDNLHDDPMLAAEDPDRLIALNDELSRVENYVEQALYYARSESVERDYLVRRHVLRDIVSAALRSNAHELIAAHITPRLEDGLDLAVFCDDKWLEFIIGQVLQNSVRYAESDTPEGSYVSFSACLLGEGSASERVDFTIADNGCGTSPADLSRVFERGFTGENGRTHKRSTGLGLWLVARLCNKMGLGVRAHSVEGEGFSVTIEFPTNKMHYFEE